MTYYTGHETIIASGSRPGMARWREQLFAFMHHNAQRPGAYFKISQRASNGNRHRIRDVMCGGRSLIRRGRYHRSRGIRQTRGKRYRASHDDPAGGSMILFAVSTLSYTDTRTIGWPFLIIIPAISAASAIAYRLPIHLEQESADLGSLARREHFLPHLWCSGTPLGSYTAGGPDAARWFASESTRNAEHVSSE